MKTNRYFARYTRPQFATVARRTLRGRCWTALVSIRDLRSCYAALTLAADRAIMSGPVRALATERPEQTETRTEQADPCQR